MASSSSSSSSSSDDEIPWESYDLDIDLDLGTQDNYAAGERIARQECWTLGEEEVQKEEDEEEKEETEEKELKEEEEEKEETKEEKEETEEKENEDETRRKIQRRQEPTPVLPEEFKGRIEEIGGSEVTFLIEKTLHKTDLAVQANRLSLPINQIKNPHFKRESELKEKNVPLDVLLVEPSLQMSNIAMVKWQLRSTSSYVLRTSWKEVVDRNTLQENEVVRIWSFRVEGKLGLALVRVH